MRGRVRGGIRARDTCTLSEENSEEKENASAPIAAATAAGRPRARGIRALRKKKIAPAGDRAWAVGL
jgi:hypothetical protein